MRQWPRWLQTSEAVRTKHNVPKATKPWTSKPNVQLRGVPGTPRVLDVLDTVWAIATQQAPRAASTGKIAQGLWVDLSQDVQRQPVTAHARGKGLHGMATSSIFYSYSADAVLSGKAHLQLLGHPLSRMRRRFTESQLRHLAGEGCSVPHAALAPFLMFANPHGQWWASEPTA